MDFIVILSIDILNRYVLKLFYKLKNGAKKGYVFIFLEFNVELAK